MTQDEEDEAEGKLTVQEPKSGQGDQGDRAHTLSWGTRANQACIYLAFSISKSDGLQKAL